MLTIHLDRIHILASVGIHAHEKIDKQPLYVSVVLTLNDENCSETDAISDTCDYSEVAQIILDLVDKQHYNLIETLACFIRNTLLEQKRIQQVVVTIEKPRAVPFAENTKVIAS